MREFESKIEKFPGSFSLPEPLLEAHMRAWWEVAVEPLKNNTRLDWEFYQGEWRGCVRLITEFGKWDVDGVAIGDLSTELVPAAVKAWVQLEVSRYIFPFFPQGMLQRGFGTS